MKTKLALLRLSIFGLLLSSVLLTASVRAETFVTLATQSAGDVSHSYYTYILKRALEVTAKQTPADIKIETLFHPGQERAVKLLESGNNYDVIWTSNYPSREINLDYVPFPLFKGLLGRRGFVIHRQSRQKFDQLKDVNALKKMVICQGSGWPDSTILQNNGFKVTEAKHFDAMLRMVDLGRCDALALSVLEGPAELAADSTKYNNLEFYSKVTIAYDLVMNFYLAKHRVALKQRIHKGLLILEGSGEFDNIMHSHALTSKSMKNLDIKTRWQANLSSDAAHLIDQRQYFLNP